MEDNIRNSRATSFIATIMAGQSLAMFVRTAAHGSVLDVRADQSLHDIFPADSALPVAGNRFDLSNSSQIHGLHEYDVRRRAHHRHRSGAL